MPKRGSSFVVRLTACTIAGVLGISGLAACEPNPTQNPIRVNFAPEGTAAPAGYVTDFGAAYSNGRGWIAQDTSTPLSIVGNARDRNLVADQRLDTFIHMQSVGVSGNVNQPARWEAAVQNGIYDVTVAAGDVGTVAGAQHRVTVESTTVINGFTPGSANKIATVTARVQVTDGKVTLDAAGGTNTKLDYVDIVPVTGAVGAGATLARINFGPVGAPAPHRYTNDTGAAYDAARGYGWISQTANTPLNITGNGLDRNQLPDQRIDTLMRMQGSSAGVTEPARWQYALPMGAYDVTVSVGDNAAPTGHSHEIAVESTTAIDNFVPTASNKFKQATVRVSVNDGFLTLDAAGGTNTKINFVEIVDADTTPRTITSADPADGATNVPLDTSVSLSPSHAVEQTTVNENTVKVLTPGGAQVDGNYNSDAAGGVVIFTPLAPLATNTTYTVQTTTGLKDTAGNPFAAFTSTFTTGTSSTPPAPVNFDKTVQADVNGPTSITIGPDGKLYVANNIGEIRRFTINADGSLAGAPQVITPFGTTMRTITGLAFEPASTSTNLRLWISSGELGNRNMPPFTGKVTLATGANLQTVQDKITGLPRSTKDHMTNGVAFGPDGKLYVAQGSLSGYGAPDQAWGFRAETPLSASILVADVLNDARFGGTASVNVNTDAGYDATAPTAAVKAYAKGTRNPYDLVWHSDGSLYVPVNESSAGNAPAGPGGNPPGLSNLPAGRDFLARVQQGKYYGHPNPSQGHYVLNGGNPTAAVDPFETPQYNQGVQPDAAWQQPILDMGLHRSANGIDEYTANVFGPTLRGKLLIAEYSNGDDILAVNPNDTSDKFQIASALYNPLDVKADPATGNVYVAEYGSDPEGIGGHITLLTPAPDSIRTPVAKINFQPKESVVPSGYSKDYGQGYEATRGFGWVVPGTGTPANLTALGRERNVANLDQRLDTFMHMQNSPQGEWQVAVPNGSYDVTVAVGDGGNAVDSVHQVSAETTVVVPPFTPTAGDKFRTATARVDVTDGFLTLSNPQGTNTKIDYVTIDRITTDGPPPADSWNPKVELTTTGSGTAPNFTGPVTVTADATDLGTGVASITYTLDGGPSQAYNGPIQVNTAGNHTVVVTATDGANRTGSATSTFTITPPAGSPSIKVTSTEDFLGLTSRLVFSNVRGSVTPARSVTIRNTGGSDLTVSNVFINGTNPNQFALADGQPTSFVVPAGQTTTVGARFTATTAFGMKAATLNIATNDPLTPNYTVALRGFNASGTVGSTEPGFQDLLTTLGYSTVTGINTTYSATTRAPVGDEIVTPYFRRADTTKPVSMVPVARYVAGSTFTSDTGWTNGKVNARQLAYRFPADVEDTTPDDGVDNTVYVENQKLLPAISSGSTTFTPSNAVFGITANYANYTDDQWNDADDGSGNVYRNLRIYPAKGPGGAVIPNTYIVGVDINVSSDKNFDYQDQVMLLSNVTPELVANFAPGSANVTLGFDAPVAGTVIDQDGQGTGFHSVQANTAGTQYKQGRLNLTGGTMRILSTAGKSSAGTNTQDNALQVHVDASRSDFTAETRILGPMSDLTQGYQQKALFFGPNQQNFLKAEIEHRTDTPGVFITLFKEDNGVTSTLAKVAVPNPASVSTLDFRIVGDMETGTLTAGYRINSSGAYTALSGSFRPANIFLWFSPQARAGILTSNEGSATSITGVYDWFRVS